jgi:ubiquinone/menaquinone biosynthesis C-methylase UbiE
MNELPPRGPLLEVGTGTGFNFDYYAPDARGVATELSFGMLVRARERTRPAGIRLVVADAQRLPFRDATFDGALATLVFCSVPDDTKGFAEVRRVLRDGARFVALEHVRPLGLGGWLFDRLNRLTVAAFGDHVNRTPAETMRRAHLTVERVDSGAGSVLQLIAARRTVTR